MWQGEWRNEVWQQLSGEAPQVDILVVGGGITGAGILREATRLGLRTLLVEQRDFSWGTSSRSSKLVHGGLRYLQSGNLRLTRASVQEREQLLQEAPGLIDPLGFLLSIYKHDFPGRWTLQMGLTVYDLLALRWNHKYYSANDFQMLAPHVARSNLRCGFRYGDAQTDDARLVLRVIREAVADRGLALNYVRAEELLWDEPAGAPRQVAGARLRDLETGQTTDVYARVVINATGAWADTLRQQVGEPARIRPLRGSHLIFPAWRFPAAQAISFWHPVDHRPVFIFPWEGVTLVGTTDMDHDSPLEEEPKICPEEVAYLMAAVQSQFPALDLKLDDILSTYAGVRPVIGTGKADPSQESREHVVWDESGLLTVTGGKLTTFRLIALDVLKALRSRLPESPQPRSNLPVLNAVDSNALDHALAQAVRGFRRQTMQERVQLFHRETRRRLLGHYGADAAALIEAARPGEIRRIPGTHVLWVELRWAARAEGVVHLDDLMMRRVRLGLMLPQGGREILPGVRLICQEELDWSDERWEAEEKAYLELWEQHYNLPNPQDVPDWKAMLAEARQEQLAAIPRREEAARRSALATGLLVTAALFTLVLVRRYRHST